MKMKSYCEVTRKKNDLRRSRQNIVHVLFKIKGTPVESSYLVHLIQVKLANQCEKLNTFHMG